MYALSVNYSTASKTEVRIYLALSEDRFIIVFIIIIIIIIIIVAV